MVKDRRLKIMLFFGVAVAALIWLSFGLTGLELLPGQPSSLREFSLQVSGKMGTLPGGEFLILLFRAIFFLGLILTPFMIFYLIISPQARKDFLRRLVRLAPYLLIFYLLVNLGPLLGRLGNRFQFPEGQALSRQLPGDVPGNAVPDPPQWLTLVVSLGLALILTAVVGGALWYLWNRWRRPERPLERIAREAQVALDALQAGGDLKNTIIRCYYEMSRVVKEQRGIQRSRELTPREFERVLEGKGLPAKPVRQLTRVFEEVRYGTKTPGEGDERLALESLTAILEVCRSSM